MSLKSLNFAQAIIETPGGNISVRGLSFDEISILCRKYKTEMTVLFEQIMGKKADLAALDVSSFGEAFLQSAPTIAADIIAMATGDGDDEEAISIARKLPLPVQIEIVEKIGQVTFTSEGSVKKMIVTMTNLMRGASSLISEVQP